MRDGNRERKRLVGDDSYRGIDCARPLSSCVLATSKRNDAAEVGPVCEMYETASSLQG
jgi:hypothetical protein